MTNKLITNKILSSNCISSSSASWGPENYKWQTQLRLRWSKMRAQLKRTYHKCAFRQRPRSVVIRRLVRKHAQPCRIAAPHFHALLRIDAVELGFGHFLVLRLEKFTGLPMSVNLNRMKSRQLIHEIVENPLIQPNNPSIKPKTTHN